MKEHIVFKSGEEKITEGRLLNFVFSSIRSMRAMEPGSGFGVVL